MITQKERESLVTPMESLLKKYNYKYTVEALNKIIDEWDHQKSWLVEAFKKHPGYVKGQFMIVVDDEYQRGVDVNGCRKFSNWWVSYPYHNTDLVKEEVRCHFRSSNISDAQFDILRNLSCYIERCISKDAVAVFKRAFPDVSIHAGEKMTRVVNKLFCYLGYDRHKDYNKEFAKYSDAMTPKTIKRRIVLSVNPLDYLTMSFGNSWSSCHTIDKENIRDMPNSYSGCYSSGTMSYMLDPSSMVLYTVDISYDGDEYWTQDKINRQMFHWGANKLVQSRLYPQANDCNGEAYTPYRAIVQNIMSVIFEFGNFWTVKKGIDAASKYISSSGTHYKDYKCFKSCTLSVVKGMENDGSIYVGANPICIECGYRHTVENNINCCRNNRIYCERCGEEIDTEDEDYVEINGYYYHCDCVNYCDHCRNYTTFDTIYIRGYGEVCDECINDDFIRCDECGDYEHHDSVIYVDSTDSNVCNDCLHGNYSLCRRCGEYFRDGELEIDEICHLTCCNCRSCASE